MRTDVLRSTTLVLGLLTATFAWAQDAGTSPQGQVPGPNATQPQADSHSPSGGTSAQPVPGADKLITVAHTFKNLKDEERRAVYDALKSQPVPGPTPSAELGIELPSSFELRPVPSAIVARIPQMEGYHYTVSGEKVFVVSPANRVVVGEFSR
jgi:hypothetical protein